MANNDQNDYAITSLSQASNNPNLVKRNTNANNEIANETGLNESVPDVENKTSKKPKNTALKQQRLPAWQPVLTAKTVFPLFFGIGVIFVILGGVLLHYSNIVNEKIIDYTDCKSTVSPDKKCADIYNYTSSCGCQCSVNFTLDSDFTAPVYFYYGLKNFYQNHRRYVKSRDDFQLLGNLIDKANLNSECNPYGTENENIYAPCGAIANSLFNDTLAVKSLDLSTDVPVIAKGIAWKTDKEVKFRNPSSWNGTIKPKNWQKNVFELSNDTDNNGYINEDLIVWMRTAALPSFRKFYRIVDHSSAGKFPNSLPKGNYVLNICHNYPVTIFGGSKSFIISTTTWIGGKNPFLGIAYLVVGCTCIVLGFVFLFIHFKYSRNSKSMEDYNNKNNNNIATVELPNRN